MALSEKDILRSKEEARDFLEYSIFTLATLLGVDIADVSGDMIIPVSTDHHEYVYYESLKKQASILEGLGI
jgi:hypothetical protein